MPDPQPEPLEYRRCHHARRAGAKLRPNLLESPVFTEHISRVDLARNVVKVDDAISNSFTNAMKGQGLVTFGQLGVRNSRAIHNGLVISKHEGCLADWDSVVLPLPELATANNVDKMNANLLVACWCRNIIPKILEGLVRVNLIKFKSSRILPLSVLGLLVELDCMIEVTILRYFLAVLVARCSVVRSEFGLFNLAQELLLIFASFLNCFQPGSSRRLLSLV